MIHKEAMQRHLFVIDRLQQMNESELDAFMEEFLKGLDSENMNPDRLALFLQLLIQMDPHLAKRFMEAISKKDDEQNGQ